MELKINIDNLKKILLFIAAIFGAIVLSSCGGGGGSDDPDDPITDVSGTWSITETMGANTCGNLVGSTDSYSLEATLSGNNLTVVTPSGTFSGRLDGDQIEWTGSYSESGGVTTIESMDITVAASGNSLSGTTSWSWTDGFFPCSGSTSITGTRTSGPPGAASESEPNDDFTSADSVDLGSVSGNVNSSSDEFDWFEFTAPFGGTFDFTLTWGSSAYDLDLGATTATQTCTSDDINTSSESCSLSLSSGEVVLILVEGWNTSASTVSYTLTIN